MGAQGIDEHNVLRGDVGKFLQQHRQHPLAGLWAGDVAEDDGHCVVGFHQIPQRRRADGLSQGAPDGFCLIGEPRHEPGFHHGDVIVGQFDPETLFPIS